MLKNRYEICLEGLNLDRLLEKVRLEDIKLYNVKRKSYKELAFSVDLVGYKKLIAFQELNEYKIQTNGKEGIPLIKKMFLPRLGIFIGMVLALSMIFIAQLFTFDIRIMGLEEVSEEQVISVLKDNGIKKYAINKFEVSQIETLLTSNIDKISMVSVAKQGTTILVNIKEKTLLNLTYTPVYASQNMIITSIVVHGGTAMVKVGDVVRAGDILVDCYVDVKGERTMCEPKAEIYADVLITGQVKFAEKEEFFERTGKKQVIRNYQIFGKEFLSSKKEIRFEQYETEEKTSYIFDGWFLPVKVKQQEIYEVKLTSVERDFESEREKTLADSRVLAYNQIGNEEVIEETSNVCKIGNVYYVQTFLKINKRVV